MYSDLVWYNSKESKFNDWRDWFLDLASEFYEPFFWYWKEKIDGGHKPVNVWEEEDCEWCKNIRTKYKNGSLTCPKHSIILSCRTTSGNGIKYFPAIIGIKVHDWLIHPTAAIQAMRRAGDYMWVIYKDKPYTFLRDVPAHQPVFEVYDRWEEVMR